MFVIPLHAVRGSMYTMQNSTFNETFNIKKSTKIYCLFDIINKHRRYPVQRQYIIVHSSGEN